MREVVAVRPLADASVEVLRSPGVVTGRAAGDIVQILSEDGRFIVTGRVGSGPNERVRAYANPQFALKSVEAFSVAFKQVEGIVEAPAHRAFVVLTVPRRVGRAWISQRMAEWCVDIGGAEWRFAT